MTKMIDKNLTFFDENDRQKVISVTWDYSSER
jgi:hypothetical protein